MVLSNRKEKFKIDEGVLVGSHGTVLHSLDEVVYCDAEDNYTNNFGFQWNRFQKTQLDRIQNGLNQTRDRFFAVTGWTPQELNGQQVLEIGSGAGRFSAILLQNTNANLFSVDYSYAVDANFRNNGPHSRFRLFRASVYELPFEVSQFDKVFCFGVLQHTPDVKQTVKCMVEMLKPGGSLVVDFYRRKGWYTQIHSKYLLRPFVRNWSHDKLLKVIEQNVDALIRIYQLLHRFGLGVLTRFVPICDINRTLPKNLEPKTLREWVVLDTFDMFSPAFDKPLPISKVVAWFEEFGMECVTGKVIRFDDVNEVAVVKGTKK